MDNHAVVIADGDGIIRLWSPGAEARFGHAAADALGQTLDLIVPTEYAQAHWEGFKRAFQSGSAAVEGQVIPFPVRLANGDVVATPGRLTLVRNPSGVVVAATVVFD